MAPLDGLAEWMAELIEVAGTGPLVPVGARAFSNGPGSGVLGLGGCGCWGGGWFGTGAMGLHTKSHTETEIESKT